MFVNHEHGQFQILERYGDISLTIIVAIICIVSVLSYRRIHVEPGQHKDFPISEATTPLFRGIAVIFLLLGHFCIKCVSGKQVLEFAGEWAVAIFVILSATGLAKKYGLGRIERGFLWKRVQKLIFSVWSTLILFYVLDYVILGRTYGWQKIILSFVGIINWEPPNGPDWFISYILFLYVVFWGVGKLNAPKLLKCLIVLASTYFATWGILSFPVFAYFGMWPKYTAIFPLALIVGIYRKELLGPVGSWARKFPLMTLIGLLGLLALFVGKVGLGPLLGAASSEKILSIVESLRFVYFVAFFIVLFVFAETWNINSRFLTFLGKYSMEIYLLHMPFMVYYDFFLFRKPLVLYFFMYLTFITLGACILRKWTDAISSLVFRKAKHN
jgi:peptidoglycan/LPS O-acetylase OafA/YrhL